jgi:hypothetical protein
MSADTQHGYLVIADISGYTSFVARTELEHSHEILSELLELLVEEFQTLMVISKLEGDAVFTYAAENVFARGETLIEFLESIYVAFRDKQTSMQRATTCLCAACRNIPSLDLKLIAHHGDYIIQNVINIRELVGSDVNLIHRLTKNHLSEQTGWKAYLMFTEHCLDHLKLNLDNTFVQTEAYEHLGEVRTYSLDLRKRYEEITDSRRILLTEEEADIVLHVDFQTPPAVAWEWLQDPEKRNIWGGAEVHWSMGDRPKGRMGKGGTNHCAHGKAVSTEVTLDWRPFEYSTVDSYNGGRKMFTETLLLEALPNGGTRLHDYIRARLPLPRWLCKILIRYIFLHVHKYEHMLKEIVQLSHEDYKSRQTI